jgi:ABC-2 type transport system permease protein
MLWLNDQVRAILFAQFKGIYNRFSGGAGAGRIFYWLSSALWYGGVGFLAALAATSLPQIRSRQTLSAILSSGLFLATLYWQFVPVMLAANGVSLDLRRLMVYPIAPSRLFAIEVLLRVSTGLEVLIVMAGASAGLIRSPITPLGGPLFLLPFIAFNLLLSAGVRDLLTRLLARRGVRELVIFTLVLLSALPQLLAVAVPPEQWKAIFSRFSGDVPMLPLPWQCAAVLAAGGAAPAPLLALAAWTLLAAWFGYSQFRRGLRWDAAESRSKERATRSRGWLSALESLYAVPRRFLPDPLGALVEKELRVLSRAPRFRLVFFMGFSFGLLIWLPLAMGRGRTPGVFSENILVWVSLYAALLLGDVLFWNSFGFDRTAAQAYFVMPVPISTVLLAKNITAVFLLLLEVACVTAVTLLLRLGFPLHKIPEAFAVTLLMCLFLLGIGNLTSIHYPRPVDPAQSWRHANSGKVQGLLLLLYPVLALPVAISYLARYAFDSEWAFYLALASAFLVALIFYRIALDSSVTAAGNRREEILAALTRGEGPIA